MERSFYLHAEIGPRVERTTDCPSSEELEYIGAEFDRCNTIKFRKPPDLDDAEWDLCFRATLRTLDPNSSTGLGAFSKYATIGQALGWDGLRFREIQNVENLRRYVRSRIRAIERSIHAKFRTNAVAIEDLDQPHEECFSEEEESQNIRESTTDGIKLFIKDEPHKIKKIEEGRMRIISSFSLVDQVVDRMLFYPFFGSEVKNPMKVTSKAGWAPIPAGYQRLLYEFPEELSLAVDKTSWDWSMPAWVIYSYFDAKMRQCINPTPLWAAMVARRFSDLYGPRCKFVMPDGVVFRQKSWGIMKSGSLLTLSMNSAAQFFQHALAWKRMGKDVPPPRIWTMGDDTLTLMRDEDISPYSHYLSRTGCILKICERSRDFAGFLVEGNSISEAKVTPLYGEKHKFMIQHIKDDDEQQVMMAFSLLYALNPPVWLRSAMLRSPIRFGPKQRLWAKGVIRLKLMDFVPSCFTY